MSDTNISDEAVEDATGKDWETWFELLDEWGAKEAGHSTTAAHLFEAYDLSGWWSQMIAVNYERARGLRDVGEMPDGYQMGKRKTFAPDVDAAWDVVTSDEGMKRWLGDAVSLEPGVTFELDDGTIGEIRVVEPHSHVRLVWKPPQWDSASTLQVRVLEAKSGRGTISFHHERLPDASARDAMKEHWGSVLDDLAELTD